MDKQMIEEMAKVIEEAMAKARRTIGGHNNIANFYATMLYNAGYRKIPEGAVVLTREEYEKLQALKFDYVKGYEAGVDEGWDNAVMQTAEKFAERVSKAFFGLNCIDIDEWNWCQRKIDEICKEITEGKV